jgi:hypothetical protein
MNELDRIVQPVGWRRAINHMAWAICTVRPYRMGKGERVHVRRVVWGRAMARAEKRDGEVIRRASIILRDRIKGANNAEKEMGS